MTDSSPVRQPERVVAIDVVRGFALLGILMVNIQAFGLLGAKYLNPMALGSLQGDDYWAWWTTYVFFDAKFMAIFSMLFGAGIVLMWERAKRVGRPFTGLHYRRMFWLALFGLMHAHLLWMGDILFLYSVVGMVIYWLCGLKSHWLIPIGFSLLLIGSAISLLVGLSVPYWDEAQRTEMLRDWNPPAESVRIEVEAYRGNWLEQSELRSKEAIFMETFLIAFWGFWRAGGLMLIGMGLYKLGVFQLRRSTRFYTVGAVTGLTLGLVLVQAGVAGFERNEWSFEYSFFIGTQFNYWGSLGVSFGYVCLVLLVCKIELFNWVRRGLAAIGQMALTNYLMHSLICTTLFYGHGFGLFEKLSRMQLIGVVVAIWTCQFLVSPIWLKRFYYGPFEWLWRSLTYWQSQPLRRERPSVEAK